MKTPPFSLAGLGLLTLVALANSALAQTDYNLSLTGNAHWNKATWSPQGMPGSGDRITDINGTASYYVYLTGDRTIDFLGKTSTGNIRIANTADQSPWGSYKLTVTNAIDVKAGAYLFRSLGASDWLSVETSELRIGDVGAGGVGVAAQVMIAETEAYSRVNFSVQKQTTLIGNGKVLITVGNADATLNLGHVVFQQSGSSSSIDIGAPISASTPHTVQIKSLRSEEGASTNVEVRGSGIVKLTGNAGDPDGGTGPANFWGRIAGDARLEKVGSDTQIFARKSGNVYTGGTLISGGVLSVRNTDNSGLGTGAVTIESGGTLAGNGQIALGSGNTVVVKSGGRIAPAADGFGPQTLYLSGENSGSAPILKIEDGGAVTFNLQGGGNHDRIVFLNYKQAGLALGETVLVNITDAISEGVYELFSFKSGNKTSASIASGLGGGLTLGTGFEGYQATFHYDEAGFGGLGVISLELTAIPEPGALALLGMGGFAGVALVARCAKKLSMERGTL